MSMWNGTPLMEPQGLRALLQQLAANPCFRSATVDELELDDDPHRRPLRPEDLDHLDLSRPVTRGDATCLLALTGNRLLACINERDRVHRPRAGRGEAFAQWCSADTRRLGEAARPHLERLMFESTVSGAAERVPSAGDVASQVHAAFAERLRVETARRAELQRAGAESRRMAWLQFAGLLDSQMLALRVARACGAFEVVAGAAALASIPERGLGASALRAQFREHDLRPEPNAHWQFLLPTTLALVNHLHALARDPRHVFALLGAAQFTALRCEAYTLAHLGVSWARPGASKPAVATLAGELRRVADDARAHGAAAVLDVALGFEQACHLTAIADDDLDAQVFWIQHMEEHRRIAPSLLERAARAGVTLPRETFVEPIELCSTTHVHDDFRLVEVESGVMVFWAAPGMRLTVNPGERILVPRGRLHGSSVLTPVCTYHQPIIPADWIHLGRT